PSCSTRGVTCAGWRRQCGPRPSRRRERCSTSSGCRAPNDGPSRGRVTIPTSLSLSENVSWPPLPAPATVMSPTRAGGGMAGGAIESGRSVVSRVAAILMAFRNGGTHSLTELARLAELPISTTHRLVGDLVARRVLERTDRGAYRVGLPLRMIGGLSLPSSPPLLEQALEV